MELKLNSMVVFGTGNVNAEFNVDGQKVSCPLNEGEIAEIRAIAFGAFERQRQALADAILTARPLQLEGPSYDEAEYDEIV